MVAFGVGGGEDAAHKNMSHKNISGMPRVPPVLAEVIACTAGSIRMPFSPLVVSLACGVDILVLF
jgi:hypothetical protein